MVMAWYKTSRIIVNLTLENKLLKSIYKTNISAKSIGKFTQGQDILILQNVLLSEYTRQRYIITAFELYKFQMCESVA